MSKGNLVNWDNANLTLVNMTSRDVSAESVCVPPRPGHVLFPERRNFSAHSALCARMRGRPSVVRSREDQEEMTDEFGKFPQACGNPDSGDRFLSFTRSFLPEEQKQPF